MTTKSTTSDANINGTQVGTTLPFDSINTPGAYLCNWSGHLLRIPDDGIIPGRSPIFNIVGAEPLTVTKISDNPFVPVTKARLVASNYDLNVNF